MNKEYNVLWLDDEHDQLKDFIIDAESADIILHGFKSYEDGFEALQKKLEFFDAILLDGMFFEEKDQVAGTEDESGIGTAIAKINELKSKKAFPWFVLSGKDSFTKNSNSVLRANKKKCYDKTNPEDIPKLFNEIKNEADKQIDTQIKLKYPKVFEVCTDDYIGMHNQKRILTILKSIEGQENNFDDKLHFTQIRIILESMFRDANINGLLHDNCINNGQVNLSESCKFLSGENTKYAKVWCRKTHFPKFIADSVWSIIKISGGESHTVNLNYEANLELKEHREYIQTPYLLYSLTFQLMDVLIWFKKYVDENPNIEINKSYWIYL